MTNLERDIRQFVADFFDYLIEKKQCEKFTSDTYHDCIKSVDFGDNFYLRFLSEWGGKNFYLTVFYKNKYLLELFLCRILFNDDGTITWYLDTPSRKENLKAYKSKNIPLLEIPSEKVKAIKSQQEELHSGKRFNKVNKGYLIAQDTPRIEVFERLEAIIYSVIGNEAIISNVDESVLEGIAKEITINKKSRTRRFIEPVKARDGYACRSCGLSITVNSNHILQVHHLKPLIKKVKTTMDDLISLCPTCHFIAHKRTPPYTLDELSEIIKNDK